MLRLLLKITAITGGIGWAVSAMDPKILESVKSAMGTAKDYVTATGIGGGRDAEQAPHAETPKEIHAVPSNARAFYGEPPHHCAGESVIELGGRVRCRGSE